MSLRGRNPWGWRCGSLESPVWCRPRGPMPWVFRGNPEISTHGYVWQIFFRFQFVHFMIFYMWDYVRMKEDSFVSSAHFCTTLARGFFTTFLEGQDFPNRLLQFFWQRTRHILCGKGCLSGSISAPWGTRAESGSTGSTSESKSKKNKECELWTCFDGSLFAM